MIFPPILQVSILQVASDKRAFVFDLIKLATDVPDVLDNCFTRILHSSRILKLGMRNLKSPLFKKEPIFCPYISYLRKKLSIILERWETLFLLSLNYLVICFSDKWLFFEGLSL